MRRGTMLGLGVLALAACSAQDAPPAQPKEQAVKGFEHLADYTGPEGAVLGALYRHRSTGMQVRLLKNESVPQAFVHVRTLPASEGGEPHTGEHLLLGKGVRGKTLAAKSSMSLVESTAYTDQTETCYSFNCAAGPETFLEVLESTLRALWLPDYTDEEIRREVCHLVVTPDESGALRLEEQGTVYNEMVSTFERRWIVFYELARRVYGPDHPLSYVAGGRPDGIRSLTPEDIRRFHDAHYHPAGTGLILALPRAVELEPLFADLDRRLTALSQDPALAERASAPAELPPIHPQAPEGVLRVPYPNANEEDTGTLLYAWTPRPQPSLADELLQVLFLAAFADGETSLLHKRFLDRSTRSLEVPAARSFGYLDTEATWVYPVIGFSSFGRASDAELEAILAGVQDEAQRLAALPPDDPELVRFNARVRTRLVDTERGYKRALSSPPAFGRRSGRNFWVAHLRDVDRQGGPARSLILREALDRAAATLDQETNPWGAVIAGLGLAERPHIALSEPSLAERDRRADARRARLKQATEALAAAHPDRALPEVLAELQAEQQAAGEAIVARDAEVETPPLVDDVPLSLDPHLPGRSFELAGLAAYAVEVEGLSATQLSFSVPLDGLRPDELVFLPLFPSLLSGVGVRSADEVLAYDVLAERLALEVGGLGAGFELRPSVGRREFSVSASGVDPAEAQLALRWLERCLREVDLDPQNLPRLRDLVRTLRRDLRGVLGRSEEGWVRNPAAGLRYQDDPLYLSCESIHTRLFHLARLTWLLEEPPGPSDRARLQALLAALAARLESAPPAAALDALGAALKGEGELPEGLAGEPARAFREGLGADLLQDLSDLQADLPPAAGAELQTLAGQLARDLAESPSAVLDRLRRAWRLVLPRRGARVVLSGTPAAVAELSAQGGAMLERLAEGSEPRPPAAHDRTPRLRARVLARHPDASEPVHYGLVHESGASGVCVFSAPLGEPLGCERRDLLALLAGAVDSGAGPHSFFMRTWGAGLAYSNGVRPSAEWGRISYYAERCPDPAQTMRFVVDLAKDPQRISADLSDYALAQLVSGHRMSEHLGSRARAAAADLLDGQTPQAVRRQREALLALRADPELWAAIRAEYEDALGRVLVGLGPTSRAAGGTYLTIANTPLLESWERYVREVEDPAEWVARVYPADYWIYPAK
ncbi:MAG: hypothetical protein R3F62_03080 [Planctomycetota bacterium]